MKRILLATYHFVDRNIIWFALLFIVAIYVLVVVPLLPGADRRRLETLKRELGVAPDLREVAEGCLTLLQSDSLPRDFGPYVTGEAEDERIPQAIRSKHPHYVHVDPKDRTVTIEFGTRDFFFGYRFLPHGDNTTEWELQFFGEGAADRKELLLL